MFIVPMRIAINGNVVRNEEITTCFFDSWKEIKKNNHILHNIFFYLNEVSSAKRFPIYQALLNLIKFSVTLTSKMFMR